jgi:hypothetical protein
MSNTHTQGETPRWTDLFPISRAAHKGQPNNQNWERNSRRKLKYTTVPTYRIGLPLIFFLNSLAQRAAKRSITKKTTRPLRIQGRSGEIEMTGERAFGAPLKCASGPGLCSKEVMAT